MMRRSLSLAAAALLALAPLAAFAQAPSPAAAGTSSEASQRFKRGVELYTEGDFNAALIEFRRAYELESRFQALYNIGETYYQLQDYASALRTLQKYLKEGGTQVPEGRREEVQKEIDKLKVRVATLEVSTAVPGVEIAVDDVSVGKTPLAAALTVSAGRRKVTATRPGKPPVTQVIEIAGGDTKKLLLDIPDDAPVEEWSRVPVALTWTATGLLAVGTAVTGALALGASSDLKAALDPAKPGDQSKIDSAHSKASAMAIAADVFLGATVVMAGVSIYLTASSGSAKKADKPAVGLHWNGAPAPTPGALRLTAGPRSVSLTGSF
jgi:hypothetical protein